MMNLALTSTQIGQITAVEGDRLRIQLADEFLESAQRDRVGQPGNYVLVETDRLRLVGLITAVEFDDQQHDPRGSMHVQLFGQIKGARFTRGVEEYPLVFDPVSVMGEDDLAVLLGSAGDDGNGEKLLLGHCSVNNEYPVYLHGEHFFSKHASVLGNSGSGKTCTVARIVSQAITAPQSQVVLFDLHGEYRRAFSDSDGRPLPNVTYLDERDLIVPYWLLRYNELTTLFLDKSDPRLIVNQHSFLKQALQKLKEPAARQMDLLKTYTIDTPIYYSLERLKLYGENMNEARFVLNSDRYAFARSALRNLSPEEQEDILLTQKAKFNQGDSEGEVPHTLYHHKLVGLLDRLGRKLNDHRYDFVLRPVEHARSSPLFQSMFPQINEDRDNWSDLIECVIRVLLGQLKSRRNLTIVDLSGIPFDMIDVTVGLLTRVIFDYNFFSARKDRQPVVLIYEEAHNYIPREDGEQQFARPAVERVAKEGRKYGVSAVVVSQRPSELSHTVLSQCNSLIVMRLSNPDDQAYVTKVISDQFADLVKMLPMLRPGEGFIIGDSVPFPMQAMVTMPDPAPASENVNFMHVWSQDSRSDQIHESLERWLRQARPGD